MNTILRFILLAMVVSARKAPQKAPQKAVWARDGEFYDYDGSGSDSDYESEMSDWIPGDDSDVGQELWNDWLEYEGERLRKKKYEDLSCVDCTLDTAWGMDIAPAEEGSGDLDPTNPFVPSDRRYGDNDWDSSLWRCC